MNRFSPLAARTRARRTPFALLASAALALVGGCATVTLDLSNIEEPVMLNPLPYASSSFDSVELESFFADASHATGGSSQAGWSSSSQILENDAQVKVFEAVGGHAHHALRIDELEVWGGGGNLLLVYAEMATVQIRGQVVELEPAATGAQAATGAEQ